MGKDWIWDMMQKRLVTIDPRTEGICTWNAYLLDYQPDIEYPMTSVLARLCFVIGSRRYLFQCWVVYLINGGGNVVAGGHNDIFSPLNL